METENTTAEAPQIASDTRKTVTDEVAVTLQEYKSAKRADEPDRNRGIRNVQFCLGLDDGQWGDESANNLNREGRETKTYNLAQYFVNGVAGNLVMNWVDPRFVDREDDGVNAQNRIKKLQQVYYADKEHGKYKASAVTCVHNGCIYRGVEELIIDRTKDPLGRLRFIPIRPDSIVMDPSNMSDNITRGSKTAYKEFYLTPQEMIDFYQDKEGTIRGKELESLEQLANDDAKQGDKYEVMRAAKFDTDARDFYGTKLLCVSQYKIVREKKRVVLDAISGEILPETAFPEGSTEDFMAKTMWAKNKGLDIQAENLQVYDKLVPCLYVRTLCKQLGIELEYKKDERQLDGNLPFYVWAFIMKNGKTLGIVDIVVEANTDINKREVAKTKVMTSTPWLGIPWYNEGLFQDANEKDETEFVDNFNDCSKPKKIPADIPPGAEMFGIKPGTNMPSGMFEDESFKINLLNQIAYLPPVLQGMGGRSGESGVLFGRKVIEANVVQQIPAKNLEQHENYKAEDWVTMAVKLYGGRNQAERIANFNRTFDTEEGQFSVNNLQGVDETGGFVVDDDLSTLKRVEVIISQAKENDYLKQAKREMNVAALQAIPPTPTNDMVRASFETSLALSMDFSDDIEKKRTEEACELRNQIAMASGQVALMQAQRQLNPPPPMSGGGMPVPGEGTSPAGEPPLGERLQQMPPAPRDVSPLTPARQPQVREENRPV